MLEDGYGILPNKILFDDQLSSTAKLMYCYISSLCARKGHCWAKNQVLAERFGISERMVQKLLGQLSPYLIVKNGTSVKRKIFLAEPRTEPRTKVRSNHEQKFGVAINRINITNEKDKDAAFATQIQSVYSLYLKQFIIPIKGLDTMNSHVDAMNAAARRYKLSPSRRAAIVRRLKDAGYNMVCAAIVGYSHEQFYLGDNERGWTADLVEFILRSYEKVEKGANMYEAQKHGNTANDPWASL